MWEGSSCVGGKDVKISIDPVIAGPIKAAWSKLAPDQQAQLKPAIMNAHQQAMSISRTGKAPTGPAASHNLILAQSMISDDADGVIDTLEAGVVVDVGADGTIWGTGKYEDLDPAWAEALAEFLESQLPLVGGRAPFSTTPQIISIPDTVQIALVGDWGTGGRVAHTSLFDVCEPARSTVRSPSRTHGANRAPCMCHPRVALYPQITGAGILKATGLQLSWVLGMLVFGASCGDG